MTDARDDLPDLPWRESPAPTPEVSVAIRKTCTRGLKKERGMNPTQRAMATVALSAGVVGLLLFAGLAQEHAEGALRSAILGAAGWGIVHGLVLFFGLVRPPGRRGSRAIRIAIAVALPVLFFAYLAVAATSTLSMNRFMHEGVGHASVCGVFALVVGAIAAGGTLFVWRRTDPLTPGLSGALAGLLGGIAGAVGVGIACPSSEAWHLWVAHGTTVLVFVIAGAFLGRKWLAP